MNVVFISGPHGCGKTAFMEALLEKSEVYIKDSFFYCDCIIDFILHNRQISNAKKTTIIKFYLWIGVFMILLFIIQWSIIWGH